MGGVLVGGPLAADGLAGVVVPPPRQGPPQNEVKVFGAARGQAVGVARGVARVAGT